MIDVIKDTLFDSIKLLPFLFLAYLLMEYLEHKTGNKTKGIVKKSGKLGPLWGGIIGIFPQCGFSAAAAGDGVRRGSGGPGAICRSPWPDAVGLSGAVG